jgi:tRNA dimethylallyltransferase
MGGWQTQWRTESPGTAAPGNVIWLDMPREALYERINARVEDMFAGGLIDEARALRALGRPLSREASKALGYAEAFAVLDGQLALKEAIVAVQTRSRNFAKRQIAWFKHLPACRPATKELTGTLLRRKINR